MIPFWKPVTDSEAIRHHVQKVLDSGHINEGEYVAEFEKSVASLLGAKYAVATTSGTAALFLALKAAGIGHGDEVLVPDVTFIATANAAKMVGAEPVLVDVDENLEMDPNSARERITSKTTAIIPVHVSGRSENLNKIVELAQQFKLFVVEDAAEAFGSMSRFFGKHLGTVGQMGCFSFSPNKTITTGQGGMVVTDDKTLAGILRALKDQGRLVRGTGGDDVHHFAGFNFKMTDLQAAVGLGSLSEFSARAIRLRQNATLYREKLDGFPRVKFLPPGDLPQWVDVLVPKGRDRLEEKLHAQYGIQCRKFWLPIHQQEPYRRHGSEFPGASRLAPQALWLPSAYTLTDADIERVCETIRGIA